MTPNGILLDAKEQTENKRFNKHPILILTNGTASLAVYSDFNTYAFRRFIADWSFENMNPKVTTCVCR
jgi:hypothetical protein